MNPFLPSLKIVELCLTYRCNVKCSNCSNLCTQAPAAHDLTAEDVAEFLHDSRKNNHTWGFITLHGGEPVLNPQIEEIVKLLVEYRKETNCTLWLLTNNSTSAIRDKTAHFANQYQVPLGISQKTGTNRDAKGNPLMYVPVNESPTDLGEKFTQGCFQSQQCGVCYNHLGFFPCSPMAAAARVFGYASAGYSISCLTEEKVKEMFAIHCGRCGFAMPERRRVFEQVTTETWEKAFEDYMVIKGLKQL